MVDKILTEAFDKLKAIEESDDPFCIGAEADTVDTADSGYTAVTEADFDAEQKSGYPGDNDDEESLEQYKDNYNKGYIEEPKVYEINTDHGDNYAIEFQDEAGTERAYIEVNGITVATYTVGGTGAMQPVIKDDAEVLNALTHALRAANGSGQ